MKIVIHAGMHKTGSSSIQHMFFTHGHPKVQYGYTDQSNHSRLFSAMFTDDAGFKRDVAIRGHGMNEAEVREWGAKWRGVYEKYLPQCKREIFLFSAEDISSFPGATRQNMIDFFRRYSDDIQILAYVRPPVSFLQSGFQQNLKGSLRRPQGLRPVRYEWRFGGMDDAFGRDNIELIKFDRKTLVGGDILTDFASRIGIDMPKDVSVSTNVSLSQEATALLWVQRKFGDGYVADTDDSSRKNEAFVDALAKVGETKLRFSAELLAPQIRKQKSDFEWMEKRLGAPLIDDVIEDPNAITSFKDLTRIALRVQSEFYAYFPQVDGLEITEKPKQLARNLDLIRQNIYDNFVPPKAMTKAKLMGMVR